MGVWATNVEEWAIGENEKAQGARPPAPAAVAAAAAQKSMALFLPPDLLDRLWPRASHTLIDGVAGASGAAFAKYGFAGHGEVADFMAQISEETGGGTALEENLSYTAYRLCQVWPRIFPDVASAEPFAHNPRFLADRVYGGRYGNRPGTQDGWTFRGRGLIQLTFRDNYDRIGAAASLDLVSNPDLALDPAYALDCAAAYWRVAGAGRFAAIGDFAGETRLVNGGSTNMELRSQWRTAWRRALGFKS